MSAYMLQSVSIHTAILLALYIISAYATTDMLRLLKGSTGPVLSRDSYCPVCHHALRLRDQIPIFSYFLCRGRCRYCSSPIPVSNLLLELGMFLLTSATALLTGFSWSGYALILFLYEGTKAALLWHFGKREEDFSAQLRDSLLSNLVVFLLLAVLFGFTGLLSFN